MPREILEEIARALRNARVDFDDVELIMDDQKPTVIAFNYGGESFVLSGEPA